MELLLIALATFLSEDLTCIAAGALVGQGRLGFVPATLACLLGIYAGDLLLFLGGRFAQGLALRLAPAEKMAQASEWMSRKGMAVVFLSRFTPGLRLPTYVAAGVLKTRFWRFMLYFLLAAAIWTPLLVGAAALAGSRILGLSRWFAATVALAALVRIFGFNWRKLRWEFWPVWAAYLPLAPYLLYLAMKHRSLTLFTAANPGIPSGGLLGESKSGILENLTTVATFELIPCSLERYARTQRALDFLHRNGLDFPIVLKPDVGERGSGVAIVRSRRELEEYLGSAEVDTIIQEYVPGVEFGVFYIRYPGEAQGRIFSITEKRFPEVAGDGIATMEQLIRRDARAACLAGVYLKKHARDRVPGRGERVRLAELGSHCRGSIFVDGMRFKTAALENAVERVSKAHPGFYFGRFDLRAADVAAFQSGKFRVIELNGVSAEATHVYDPAVSTVEAYRVMRAQWRMAFEIGAMNRLRGVEPMSVGDLLRLIQHRKRLPSRAYAGTLEMVD